MAGERKNMIPLILAVVLALAAVYMVHKRLTTKNLDMTEEMVTVAMAGQNLKEEQVLVESLLAPKQVPRSAIPSKAVFWNQRSMILNQKMKNAVSSGDYIVLDDIGVGAGLSDMIGDGEWAVSITLNGGAITSRLRPGDEIAIVGTYNLKERKKSMIVGEKGVETTRKITLVVMPQVRILALTPGTEQGGDEFVLALQPTQAQVLLGAQAHGVDLTPALRKPHDESNLNRVTSGYVDEETFNELAKGVERTLIPMAPNQK